MRSPRSALFALLTAAALVASTAFVGASPASAALTTREARVVAKINAARAYHGLPALRTSPDLMAAARAHTKSMAGRRVLFHSTSFTSVCCWASVAENVGTGYSVRGVHRSFMGSAPHRANILNRRMRQVGVGVVYSGGKLWVTEVFRQPA